MSRRYRGHRHHSFVADVQEIVELRARQRTFYGAYNRTALGMLCYGLVILRLFDRRFYRIGILFSVLGCAFFILAFFRSRHSWHDFADRRKADGAWPEAIVTVGTEGTRVFGRPFITAGWIVIGVSFVVALVEIILFILVLQI